MDSNIFTNTAKPTATIMQSLLTNRCLVDATTKETSNTTLFAVLKGHFFSLYLSPSRIAKPPTCFPQAVVIVVVVVVVVVPLGVKMEAL